MSTQTQNVCIALIAGILVMVIGTSIASCNQQQYQRCLESRRQALESGNPVVAATIRCEATSTR